MLEVKMTPNLLGFRISGDYYALDELYDAIWSLTIAEEDFPDDTRMRGTEAEQIMSTRLLALNYDIRHAYQGSRGVSLVHSGMHEWDAERCGLPLVERNVVFSVEVLYPEAMYEALVLNYLITKRERELRGTKSVSFGADDNEKTMLDFSICIVREYLGKLLAAVEKEASPGRFTRIRKELTCEYFIIDRMYQQWVDVLNNDYASMTRKQRAESLSTIVRDLAEFLYHEQYRELTDDVDAAAKKYGTTRDNIRIPGLYEWDEPEW